MDNAELIYYRPRVGTAFNASFTHSLAVSKAISGSLTHPANDTADYERLVPDHEGIYRAVKQNASRHYGARVVENLDPASEDITQLSSSGVNTTVDDTETVTITTNTNNAYRTLQILTGLTFNLTSGISAIVSFEIENISGNGTIGVRVHDGANNYNEVISIDLTTLTTAKRFSIPVSGASGGATPTLSIEGRSAGGGDGSVTGSFKIKRIMFEDSTGRLDTTTPSEYVSTGVATGDEIWDGSPDAIGDGWTDNGDGSYTSDGSQAANSNLSQNGDIDDTKTYVITYTLIRTSGTFTPLVGGTAGTAQIASGTYTDVIQGAAGGDVDIDLRASSSFTGTVSAITVKKLDHGNNVDGQKSFNTENPNIVVSNVVTALSANGDNSGYVDLDGTGDYVSTPASAANSITGDIDIRALIQPDDWTPAASEEIVTKRAAVGHEYDFRLKTDGTIELLWHNGMGFVTPGTSSASVSGTDGEPLWVRATRTINGANYEVDYYTSTDGSTWTQLGTTQTETVSGNTPVDSGHTLNIGAHTTGSLPFTGKIYRAQIFNEIDGTTPVVDFNPGKDSQENDTSFTSSTGEVWTTQADASLHKKGLPLGRNLISNNGLSNDTVIGTGGNFVNTDEYTTPATATIGVDTGRLHYDRNESTVGDTSDFSITTISGATYSIFVDVDVIFNGWSLEADNTDSFSTGVLTTAGVSKYTFTASSTTTTFSISGRNATTAQVFINGIYITPGIPLAGLMMEGAATNELLHCRDWTNAAYAATNITPLKDATGIDGKPNAASTLTAGAANGTIFQTVTLASAAYNTSVWVRRKTGTGAIEITDNGGTNYTAITSLINSSTYTQVQINRTQANPVVGFRIVTSGDEIEVDFGAVVAGTHMTSPIETTTVAVTRPADTGYTLAGANWTPMDANGSVSLELTPLFEGVAPVGNVGIVNPYDGADRGIDFGNAVANRLVLYDGTNVVVADSAWQVPGQTIGIKTSHSSTALTQDLAVDGVGATQAAYDVSYNPSGDITLGKLLTLGMCLRNLQLITTPLDEDWRLS